MKDEVVSFDRAELSRLLALLDDRLREREVAAQIYVVGGAAIALAISDTRRTLDVDVRHSSEVVLVEARALAVEEGLPAGWLNGAARGWIPSTALAPHDETTPGLAVHVAPVEVLLAMKMVSMRSRDISDIMLLARELGMTTDSAEDFASLLRRVYAGEDELQGHLGVPHNTVERESLHRGRAVVAMLRDAQLD